ncbi:MAG: 2-oxoglutarate dehydrogenase E1 component, partial [Trueperaceae bacterium]
MDLTAQDDLLNSSSLEYVEQMYAQYVQAPDSVPEEWRLYFAASPNGHTARGAFGPSFKPSSLFNPAGQATGPAVSSDVGVSAALMQQKLDRLVRNYRVRGHRLAQLSPLGRDPFEVPELDPSYYGITQADMSQPVLAPVIPGAETVGEVIEGLQTTYCRSIGAQFMHVDSLEVRVWLQRRMESSRNRLSLSRSKQLRILTKLTDATIFEDFIQKKFLGAKSFSLEGSETLIPLLDQTIEKAGDQGIEEVVLGMAHRGRLNVLANILGKNPRTIFREFEDADPEMYMGRGDVKYHLGYSNDWITEQGKRIHLSLAFNPSHLEFVNPVVLGRSRAKGDRMGDVRRDKVLPIMIHGDAAFAGQGVSQETLNLSGLVGYRVGGALHVIVNNQVGFTTGPRQGRSTTYATDVAKMLQIPVFHVNGEDPEAVAQVIELAMDFREEFRRDVVIDMYAYRRFGHNETDEPAFTQPVMYEKIRKRQGVRESYLGYLKQLGEVTTEDAERVAEERRAHLDQELSVARSGDFKLQYSTLQGIWADYLGGLDAKVPEANTAIEVAEAGRLLEAITVTPEEFNLNSKIARQLTTRVKMARGEQPLDWAAGEALAFASLVSQGVKVRMTGQDVERGTFSHRHQVFHDSVAGYEFLPMSNVEAKEGLFEIHNSPLSEIAVLAYEYGYSLDMPEGLVIWEAQYGDFVNVAQVIIDQFLASAEEKWSRLSGLVLQLPHAFEGGGPEHSSARLERFLQLCAEDNMQVVYPTTPAQIFHLLRRQVLRPYRKPLIIMSPK